MRRFICFFLVSIATLVAMSGVAQAQEATPLSDDPPSSGIVALPEDQECSMYPYPEGCTWQAPPETLEPPAQIMPDYELIAVDGHVVPFAGTDNAQTVDGGFSLRPVTYGLVTGLVVSATFGAIRLIRLRRTGESYP